MRKETVNIDIFIISWTGDKKIMQPIRTTSGPPVRIRNWDQFGWAKDSGEAASVGQAVLHTHFCSLSNICN